ncbi:MAG: carboxypeptidase-like regulatory domain-containing protein [Acidobacteriota bacterium]
MMQLFRKPPPVPWRAAGVITLMAMLTAAVLIVPGAPAPQALGDTAEMASTARTTDSARLVTRGLVAGKVRGASSPLATVRVYAYEVADATMRKVVTDDEGNFLFEELPAGIYKVVAHKSGFVPAVVMLARRTATSDQFLDLELRPAEPVDEETGGGFWAVRRQLPDDVLKEIGLGPAAAPQPAPRSETATAANTSYARLALPPVLQENLQEARLQALAGREDHVLLGDTQLSGGQLLLEGALGSSQINVDGYFMELQPTNALGSSSSRQSRLAVAIQDQQKNRLEVEGRNHRLNAGPSLEQAVDFEQYRVSWSSQLAGGESRLSAQYTSENNFYSLGNLVPQQAPMASNTLSIEGSYAKTFGDRADFSTRLSYREREAQMPYPGSLGANPLGPAFLSPDTYQVDEWMEESVELLGQGGYRIRPALLLEYGLLTRLQDGSLSLTPRGGFVLQLNNEWQASGLISERVHQDDEALPRLMTPAYFHEAGQCDASQQRCYQLALSHEEENGNRTSLSAIHREFGETLRLFFHQDFFNHLESLYLVDGDRLPEVQVAMTRRLSPSVSARLESNLASGGGGIIMVGDELPYENRVRYFVTSLDTQFQNSSTGIFVAFQHLLQELDPMLFEADASQQLALERLQLMLTQDLSILADLAATWEVKLNMELSRGNSPLTLEDDSSDELRKRFLGGVAVRF